MQGPDFLHFLQDDQYRFFYVDEYGNVKISTTPRPLVFAPDGHDEISIIVERNKKYFGLERSFTIPYNYVEDGAIILKYLAYNFGMAAKLLLLIMEQKLFLSDTEFGFYYDFFYRGEPDFSTFSHLDEKVTINTIEGGLLKLIKANENIDYEIDFNVPEAHIIQHDGHAFQATSLYTTIDELQTTDSPTFNYVLTWLQLSHVNNEGTVFDTEQQSTDALKIWLSNTAFDDNKYSENYFFKANAPLTIKFKATFNLSLTDGLYTKVYIKNSNGSRIVLLQLDGTPGSAHNTAAGSFDIDQEIILAAGETIYLISETLDNLAIAGSAVAQFKQNEVEIHFTSRYKTTYIYGLPPVYVYQQLVKKITNGKYLAHSDLLYNNEDHLITCADAIRGLPNPKLKINLSKFFNWTHVRFNTAMGVYYQGKLVLEKKEFWFGGDIIDLEEPVTLRVLPAIDYMYNSFKVGYPNQTYDNVNGRDEFNVTQQWSTDLTQPVKEYTLISDIRTDMYGIELLRANLDGKKTTDSSSDNDAFCIHVQDNPNALGYYELDRSLNAGATGLINPETAYNLRQSPKNCLLEHGWEIRSFLDKLEHSKIKYQTGDKNSELVAGGIREREDITVGDLPEKKFLPWVFEIEVKTIDNYMSLLNENPIRKYRFPWKGNFYTGIALKTGIEPSTNKIQIFQLLATPDNDLSTLIPINI